MAQKKKKAVKTAAKSSKKTSAAKSASKTRSAAPQTDNTAKDKKSGRSEKNTAAALLIVSFICGLVALYLFLCYIVPSISGAFGRWIRTGLFGSFGIASLLIPTYLLLLAVFLRRIYTDHTLYFKLAWGVLATFSISVFFGLFSLEAAKLTMGDFFDKCKGFAGGGAVGGTVAQAVADKLGTAFTGVVFMILFIVFGALSLGITPMFIASAINKRIDSGAEKIKQKKAEKKKPDTAEGEEEGDGDDEDVIIPAVRNKNAEETGPQPEKKQKHKKAYDFESEEPDIVPRKHNAYDDLIDSEDEGVEEFVRKPAEIFLEDGILVERPVKVADKPVEDVTPDEPVIGSGEENGADDTIEAVKEPVGVPADELVNEEPRKEPAKAPKPYRFPPLKLLSLPDGKGAGISADEAKNNARKIVETLSNFGITVSVENISCGPTITRYELRPAPGVRISRIGNLIDDLARVLASGGVRFESSIEGKDTVGIEVPNKSPFTVNIRTLLDTDTFRSAKSKVFCALGVDVSNEPTFLDIQKMPHMIIAGATGMGKSVCINSLIVSILYRATPDEVKLIMIDPKKVEFAPYVGIPHLLVPVITDMKKAAGALNWLVQEMERRYDLIEATGCRNIFGYNDLAKNDPEMEKLPIMVIIIDELADLMATSKDNVESSIARIAAKARAAGMHLIIGTQRPDVSVISGTIKNNIPSRIACRVGSQIDSRTILDEGGAERLIGRGDMLFKPVGALKLTRLQGAFVSDEEVEAVVNFIKNQGLEANYSDEAIKNIDKEAENISDGKKKLSMAGAESGDDELLLSAIEISFDAGKVATSLLNRKLSIGYGRAAKIIDRMEEMGICSGANGSKPRELIMSREQFMAKYGNEE